MANDLIKILLIKIVLNIKIKSFGGKITTEFYGIKEKEKLYKIDSHCFCLPEIIIDLVYTMRCVMYNM